MENVQNTQKAGFCPKCGRQSLEYRNLRLDGDVVVYPWTCLNCNAQGDEIYNIDFVKHIVADV